MDKITYENQNIKEFSDNELSDISSGENENEDLLGIKRKCPKCSHKNPISYHWCEKCGTKLF